MKLFRKIILGIGLCFTFMLVLVSCSNVNKGYADKINNAYQEKHALTYDDVKRDLGDECVDTTKVQNGTRSGLLIAVKGVTAGEYKERIEKASSDEKFDYISVTVVQGNCTYAYYATVTASEIRTAQIQ